MKERQEKSPSWQSTQQHSVYLDTAYKKLVREEMRGEAVKNRAKVLNIDQEHILKQVQNNQQKHYKLDQVKYMHTKQNEILSKDKQKKSRITEQQRKINQQKKKNHEKQMTEINLLNFQDKKKIREQAKRNRKQNLRLIEQNRHEQLSKKRQIHNKIHDDIMQSRSTIQNFFATKHQSINQATQEEIRRLNHKRIKEQLLRIHSSSKVVCNMQRKMDGMKQLLKKSRVGIEVDRNELSFSLKKKEAQQPHPLVRKIDTVLSQYTKFL